MVAMAFDTLKLARTLRSEAKMPLEQAEGVAQALAEAMSGAELATKADVVAAKSDLTALINSLRNDLTAMINTLRTELSAAIESVRAELKQLEQRMTIKLGAMLAAGIAIPSMLKVFGH
ncbi:MAG: hypothetical protein WCO00_15900 [Rhodospirillaceae bacterium]